MLYMYAKQLLNIMKQRCVILLLSLKMVIYNEYAQFLNLYSHCNPLLCWNNTFMNMYILGQESFLKSDKNRSCDHCHSPKLCGYSHYFGKSYFNFWYLLVTPGLDTFSCFFFPQCIFFSKGRSKLWKDEEKSPCHFILVSKTWYSHYVFVVPKDFEPV